MQSAIGDDEVLVRVHAAVGKNVKRFKQGDEVFGSSKRPHPAPRPSNLSMVQAAALPMAHQTYPLSRTPEALLHIEGGHARGKVVITV